MLDPRKDITHITLRSLKHISNSREVIAKRAASTLSLSASLISISSIINSSNSNYSSSYERRDNLSLSPPSSKPKLRPPIYRE